MTTTTRKIKSGDAPPHGITRISQHVIKDLTDLALTNRGEWHSLDLEKMNTGNSLTTAAANIGKALAEITTRDGTLYVRVKK